MLSSSGTDPGKSSVNQEIIWGQPPARFLGRLDGRQGVALRAWIGRWGMRGHDATVVSCPVTSGLSSWTRGFNRLITHRVRVVLRGHRVHFPVDAQRRGFDSLEGIVERRGSLSRLAE